MLITYTIKIKRANPRKWICPYCKNDITTIVRSQKPVIYSSNMELWLVTASVEKAQQLKQVQFVWFPLRITKQLFSFFLFISQIANLKVAISTTQSLCQWFRTETLNILSFDFSTSKGVIFTFDLPDQRTIFCGFRL